MHTAPNLWKSRQILSGPVHPDSGKEISQRFELQCVMEGGNGNADDTEQFIATGRTGRRNAIADIDKHAAVSTADLPEAMKNLSCGEGSGEGKKPDEGAGEGTSGVKPPGAGS